MKALWICLLFLSANGLASGPQDNGDSLPLSGIGKGTQITLTQDVLIPANQEWVDLPTRSYWGPKKKLPIGYGMYFEEWVQYTHTCRLYVKDRSLDKRTLPSGTHIILSGEYSEEEQDPQSRVRVQELWVSSPSLVLAFACGGYSERFRSFLGENPKRISGPHGPVLLTIGDFKNLIFKIGTTL